MHSPKKNLFLALFLLNLSVFSLSPRAEDESSCSPEGSYEEAPKSSLHEADALKLFKNFSAILKAAGSFDSELGETCDASQFIYDLVMKDGSTPYKTGDAYQIFTKNEGLIHHFESIKNRSSRLSPLEKQFIEACGLEEKKHPIRSFLSYEDKPSLQDTTSINFFDLALKTTKDNVFQAVTLLGKLGHDDVGSLLSRQSQLFARHSLGPQVDIPPLVLENYLKISSVHEPSLDVGNANQYHLIAGFFMGCELAKRGYKTARLPKSLVNLIAKEVAHSFLPKQWKTEKRLLMDRYCLDLCVDLPASSSYCYKQLTLPHFLSEKAKLLLDAGYTRPFQNDEKDFQNFRKPLLSQAPFQTWSEEKWERTINELNLRLMNTEYTYAQHQAGAKFGSEVCSKYKEKVKPPALRKPKTSVAKDAAHLYQLGYFTEESTPETLNRASLRRWTLERKKKALTFLQGEIQKHPAGTYGFGEWELD